MVGFRPSFEHTPTGPPYMHKKELERAMQIMVDTFEQEFLR